jgi:hypothetical protein
MHAIRISMALASVVLLSACGLLGGQGEGKTNPVEAIFKDPLTTAQIKPTLLTVDDMPAGYSVDHETSDDSDSGELDSTTAECTRLFTALERQDKQKAFGKAEINFKADDFGPFVSETVSSFKGSKIKDQLAVLDVALAKCPSFTTTDDDGAKLTFEVEELSFPDLGDQTVAGRLTAKEPTFDIAIEFQMVAVRVDQNMVALANFGLGKGMSAADFEAVVRKAVERVQAAS